VEGACAVLTRATVNQIPAEIRQRVLVALRSVADHLGTTSSN
jgi:hypothetical protein